MIVVTIKFRDRSVEMISIRPFLITFAALLALLVSNDVSDTASVRSSGVDTPISDGTPSTNMISIARVC